MYLNNISYSTTQFFISINYNLNLPGGSSFKLIGGVQVLPAGAVAPGGRAAVVKEPVSSSEGESTVKKEVAKTRPKDEGALFTQVNKSYPFKQGENKL